MKKKELSRKSKTFVMGDIHGAYRALLQCLDRSGFDKEYDTLIHVGDVSDGWSQTPQCVDELLSIKNLISLRGNHDVWTLNWFLYGEATEVWLSQGGRATRDAYLNLGLVDDPKHGKFWNDQMNYYIDDENRLFVHAGFNLYYGFNWSKNAQVYEIRNSFDIHWTRDCANFNTKSWSNNCYKFLDEFKEIFIGHTQHYTTNFNYPEKRNIWNIDTGCGHRGKLTIMDVDTKEYWQSDDVKTLYPNEVGRG